MQRFWTSLFVAMLGSAAAALPSPASAQADPVWLGQWNVAQASRPQLLTSTARIAPPDEPGTPLVIRGVVVGPYGEPAADVVVHAYHRDDDGFDFGPGDRDTETWRLQGWVVTDANGRLEFRTIRPAPDALGREGAHVHFTLESTIYGRQWAPKVFFADDPQVSDAERRRSASAGDFGWVVTVREHHEVQYVDVRIRLGENEDF